VYRPSFRVDYTERRKTERKNVSNEHYITGPPQREEILRERKMKRFLNFIKVCHNEFFERITFFISFVVFGAVYRPSSRVDYTERRKTERKNVSNEHYITGPPQREEILRERKMKRFLNFIFEVCHNEVFFKLQDQLTFKTF
jgi:hypothetical protein